MSQIEILSEEEGSGEWSFEANVLDDDGALHPVTIRLAWADYNLWSSSGADAPAAIAAAVLRFVLVHMPPAELPAIVDAARIRRRYPDADDRVPGLIG